MESACLLISEIEIPYNPFLNEAPCLLSLDLSHRKPNTVPNYPHFELLAHTVPLLCVNTELLISFPRRAGSYYLQKRWFMEQRFVNRQSRENLRAAQLAAERDGNLPVRVRTPKYGREFFSGCSRAKLYKWAAKGFIRSVSIRELGRIKGVRLFHLASVLGFIERCEAVALTEKINRRIR
jgi:hypothetical protein